MTIENTGRRPPITVKQAAEYCGLREGYLTELRFKGGGPAFCKLARKVLYLPDDLDAWLEDAKRTSTSDRAVA